jgi:hypothetical protein
VAGLFDQLVSAFQQLRARQPALPMAARIPDTQCSPATAAGYPIRREEMYFTVRVHELFLARSAEWWKIYDPLALVTAEFDYGTDRISVPSIIGPDLIKRIAGPAKHGVILNEIRVVGPYPYRGGELDLSVSLYAVERQDYATGLLHVVDRVATAVGDSGDMAVMSKVGGAVVESVETLLGLQQTVFLTGHRFSTGSHPVDGFRAGYFALFSPPAPSLSKLKVQDHRLMTANLNGEWSGYTQSDYVLYSVMGSDSRGDKSNLPFYRMLRQAERAALGGGTKSWQRAKATLQTWFEQMLESPDFTQTEAWRLLDFHLKRLEELRENASKLRTMPLEQNPKTDPIQEVLDRAASLIQL